MLRVVDRDGPEQHRLDEVHGFVAVSTPKLGKLPWTYAFAGGVTDFADDLGLGVTSSDRVVVASR